VVIFGALTAPALGGLLGVDPAAMLGLLSGATTNTPSLGAVQQTLTTLPGVSVDRQELPALAYAVSYPIAIAGIIGTLLALKAFFHIDPVKEAEIFALEQRPDVESLERRTLVVENANLEGLAVEAIPGRLEMGVTVSRIRRSGENEVNLATANTLLQKADRIVAVGTTAMLDRFQKIVGRPSDEDLLHAPGCVTSLRVVLTNKRAMGKTVAELGLDHSFGIVVTRITRAGLEMSAVPSLRLHFGDVLQVVGDQASIQKAAVFLGNSLKKLNEMHFVPLLLFSPAGALWLVAGFIITVLPLLLVGGFARIVLKMNFTALSGLLAGSMTDPQALEHHSLGWCIAVLCHCVSADDGATHSFGTNPGAALMRVRVLRAADQGRSRDR
jgi:putative transport protein